MQALATERKRDAQTEIKCRFCHWYFRPEPEYRVRGKYITRVTTCPRCGNGIERTFRYAKFKTFGGYRNG